MLLLNELYYDIKYLGENITGNPRKSFIFDGEKGPIVGIPGIGGGWNKTGLRKYMHQNGVSGTLTYYGSMTDDLDKYIDLVNKDVNKYKNPVLVGYSSGGLIALKYAQKYGWNKIKKIITVATPFWGSPIASYLKLFGKSYVELSPGSKYLSNIKKIKPPENKVISIFAKEDLKAPFAKTDKLNWECYITKASSHGQIHENYKFIEPWIKEV